MLDRIYTKSSSEVDSLRQKSIAKGVATLSQIVHAQKTDGKLNLTLRQRRAAIKTRDGTIWGTKKSFDRKIATSRSSAVNTSRLVLVAAGIVVNATLSVLFVSSEVLHSAKCGVWSRKITNPAQLPLICCTYDQVFPSV